MHIIYRRKSDDLKSKSQEADEARASSPLPTRNSSITYGI